MMEHTTAAAEQVRVLDHILNGNYHPIYVEQDEELRLAEQQVLGAQQASSLGGLYVSPNPFEKAVRFTAPAGTTILALEISDLRGQRVYHSMNRNGQSTVTWRPEKLPQGLYLYTCRLSTGEVWNGKLAKTNQ